jgi:hypothetical protein
MVRTGKSLPPVFAEVPGAEPNVDSVRLVDKTKVRIAKAAKGKVCWFSGQVSAPLTSCVAGLFFRLTCCRLFQLFRRVAASRHHVLRARTHKRHSMIEAWDESHLFLVDET